MAEPTPASVPNPGPAPQPYQFPFTQAATLLQAIQDLYDMVDGTKSAHLDAYHNAKTDLQGAAHDRFVDGLADRMLEMDHLLRDLDADHKSLSGAINKAHHEEATRDGEINNWKAAKARYDTAQASLTPH